MNNHPCFDARCIARYGRLHIPVAAECNISCNYCSRRYDCQNESRPGVTSRLLSLMEVEQYLSHGKDYIDRAISVLGIAGPGDPMATPINTLETLHLVHSLFPDKLLCLSTNGLNLCPYIDKLVSTGVSHVTVTINAVDPYIGKQIYSWVDFHGVKLHGIEGAELLLRNQLDSLARLKDNGIVVKVNTVVVPDVNDRHVVDIARVIAGYKVDLHNCIAMMPVRGTEFESIKEPSAKVMNQIRREASHYIPQSYHCNRCRADSCGLLK